MHATARRTRAARDARPPRRSSPWAREPGLPEDAGHLARHADVQALLLDVLDAANSCYTRIDELALRAARASQELRHPRPRAHPGTAELTPALKVKRTVAHAGSPGSSTSWTRADQRRRSARPPRRPPGRGARETATGRSEGKRVGYFAEAELNESGRLGDHSSPQQSASRSTASRVDPGPAQSGRVPLAAAWHQHRQSGRWRRRHCSSSAPLPA
jgi:hypothetical protein